MIPAHHITQAVKTALHEDLGRAGDITSSSLFAQTHTTKLQIVTRAKGVICGMAFVKEAFHQINPACTIMEHKQDKDHVTPQETLATIEGPTRDILAAERTALNFLTHLSGIATLTQQYVSLISHTKAKITDTRKTIPGLRALQKYAVRCGGGVNHRFGLDDAVLIKDNHIAAAGSITSALTTIRASIGHMVKVEIEVDTLAQLEEVLASKCADGVLCDNMPPTMLRQAVTLAKGQVLLEASGGITLDSVKEIAETGIDYISIGRLTHSAPQLDIGLDIT